jgi:hypothetical protein
MTVRDAGTAEINKRLLEAIDRLRQDALRVEIWATALDAYSRPIPNYDPFRELLLKPQRKNDD